jgi:hypothetical protein
LVRFGFIIFWNAKHRIGAGHDADPVAGTIAAAASQWWHKAITTSSTSPSVNVFATTASAAALGF